MTSESWALSRNTEQSTSSTATLGHISEVGSDMLYATPLMDDSISLSSNIDDTPTSSSSSFKTTSTCRIGDICHQLVKMPKRQAILAEAEDIDDIDDMNDDLESTTQSKTLQTIEKNNKLPLSDSKDFLNKKINEIKSSLASSGSPASSEVKLSHKNILSPLEKVSNEAKEYWATIDLYNNSKVAFNKRSKSVRLKREKLNNEWQNRFHNSTAKELPTKITTSASNHNPDECKCVKCTISYHETLIKSGKTLVSCSRCSMKSNLCKCTVSTPINENKKQNQVEKIDLEVPKANIANSELGQFEEKLFNIKSELVNLSETSLDVFQLLLQLSDTMLELNSQLNSSTSNNQSQSQLLFINQLLSSNLNIEQNFDLNSASTEYNLEFLTPKPEAKSHNRRIEDFLQKTIGSVKSASNTMSSNKNGNFNSKSQFLVPAAPSPLRSKPSDNHYMQQLLEYSERPIDESSSERLIDNLYDKNSVTQFVDSFFNSTKNDENTCYYSVVPNSSTGQYSNSDFIVDENPYQSIDEEFLGKVEILSNEPKIISAHMNPNKHSSSESSDGTSLSSGQSSLSRQTPQKYHAPLNWIATETSNSPKGSSSNSSSSGCIEAGSSIASSSNVDLSSLPSASSSSTNITNETHSTAPSFLANETQTINRRCLNNNDYNKMTDNLIRSYHHVQTKPKKVADIPLTDNHLNTIINSNQFGQQRSNSVNYKATPVAAAAAIYATGSTRRKPSFKFDSTILNRVQTMEKTRSDSIDEEGAEVKGTEPQAKATFPHKIYKSNHQISLDSGIYLPSENEEINSASLLRS